MLRIAHLTDIHMKPKPRAMRGLEQTLIAAQEADLIITGGDQVMDAWDCDQDKATAQWRAYHQVMAGNRVPVRHTLGNHDHWMGKGADYAKQWACDELGLEKPYTSWDQDGWHLVTLDSTLPLKKGGYTARLDGEQFEWLCADLSATKLPTCIVSHIPILSVTPYLDGDNEASGDWRVPGAWMHIDARRIKDLFLQHPHVKLCLSGHIHLRDEVIYNGVHYFCNGAVCGGWWKGDYQECPPGFAFVELRDDGTFSNQYVAVPEE